jgi:hypothetical protein
MNQALTAFVLMFYDFEQGVPFFAVFSVRKTIPASAEKT